MKQVVIIGGGISGCLTALELSRNKLLNISLFEKRNELLSGPPFCHLHAGGMLYPTLSLIECETLLNHSLLFAKYFKDCLIDRPTIIAYRKDTYNPLKLIIKCKMMQYIYSCWTKLNKEEPLGPSNTYYAIYTREDLENFKKDELYNTNNNYHDLYVKKFCKLLNNIDDIQYPFVSVREPGISMEKISFNLKSKLKAINNIKIYTSTRVDIVEKLENKWQIEFNNTRIESDCLINAAGCNINELYTLNVDTLPSQSSSLVKVHVSGQGHVDGQSSDDKNKECHYLELKSSWLIKNTKVDFEYMPEIAIIGERGTSNGMIQITPTENKNIFQLHCMTYDSTLFKDGCVTISNDDKTPIYLHFPKYIQDILKNDCIQDYQIDIRTQNAIRNISDFFPIFKTSLVYGDPLWGIQRIVGESKDTRTNDYIIIDNYVEIQIIKAISSVWSVKNLVKNLNVL
jgi:hypothetical protein